MIKVRLLNSGGYGELEDIQFPIEVCASSVNTTLKYVMVPECEIERIGGSNSWYLSEFEYAFRIDWGECEIIDDESE